MQTIKLYKETYARFFGIIVEETKAKNKIEKQISFQKNIKEKDNEIEYKIFKKANKLNFIARRKVAIPYRPPKKNEKKSN